MDHVYTHPAMIVIFIVMVGLVVMNEIHRRRDRRERERMASLHRAVTIAKATQKDQGNL